MEAVKASHLKTSACILALPPGFWDRTGSPPLSPLPSPRVRVSDGQGGSQRFRPSLALSAAERPW